MTKDDEVIIPSFTYFATLSAVLRIGAKPIFADIEDESFCLSLELVKSVVSNHTKCVIPVNLFGYSSDVVNIKKVL